MSGVSYTDSGVNLEVYDESMAIALSAMVRVDAIPEFERLLKRFQGEA